MTRTMLGPGHFRTEMVRFVVVQKAARAAVPGVATAAKASDNARFQISMFGIGWPDSLA
ncbi:MAG: hypothetical protein R3E52_02435 [Burkholderiaceae bacterium]